MRLDSTKFDAFNGLTKSFGERTFYFVAFKCSFLISMMFLIDGTEITVS